MASDTEPPTLMTLPLEVRHRVFDYVAQRDTKPEKLLRYWFEKMEVKAKTAELVAADPNVGTPRVVYEGDQFEEEALEVDSEEDGEEDSEEDNDEDEDEENGEGDDGDEEQDEEDEAGELDGEMEGTDSTDPSTAASSTTPASTTSVSATPAIAKGIIVSDIIISQATAQAQQHLLGSDQTTTSTISKQPGTTFLQDSHATNAGADAANTQVVAVPAGQSSLTALTTTISAVPQISSQSNAEDEDADADMAEDSKEDVDAEDGPAEEEDAHIDDDEENDSNADAEGDSDEDMEGEYMEDEYDDEDEVETGAAQILPAPVITAHRKWRHIPKFMRITHCPPPVELCLTSKQLNAEAKNWFYDVAVLHIEATGSFAHTSFFEEAFSQITEAALSPIKDIRKVNVTFVWDSTWLRRADYAAAIFPALLRQRAIFVTNILAQAPNLSAITIHWHDSAEDEETTDLMNDVLMGFLGLDATVKVEPHYIAAEAKPYKESIAGKQRVAFQRIVNNGLDRLF